jgi:hypothetical protein
MESTVNKQIGFCAGSSRQYQTADNNKNIKNKIKNSKSEKEGLQKSAK